MFQACQSLSSVQLSEEISVSGTNSLAEKGLICDVHSCLCAVVDLKCHLSLLIPGFDTRFESTLLLTGHQLQKK